MQVIYLDTLLAVNLFIDYILLSITKTILHINTKQRRLLLGASLGALLTLTIFIPIYSVFLSALVKLISAIIVTITAFPKGYFRKTTVRALTYLGISMILSTAVVIINNFLNPTGVIVYKDTIYINISPKILIISTAVIYLIISIYERISTVHKIKSETHKVTLTLNNNSKITFESAVDTGCNLREPFSGLPVILTEESLLTNQIITPDKMRIIPFSTAAGSDLIMGFKPDYLAIDGKELHSGCYIGICKNKLQGEIKSIMGPEFLEAI